MSGEASPVESVCPHCGAGNPAGAVQCSSCGRTLATTPASTNPYEAPRAPIDTTGALGRVAASVVGVVLILISTVIAFVATCFPIGLVTVNSNLEAGIYVAIFGGLAAAGATLFFSIKLFKRVMRRKEKPSP